MHIATIESLFQIQKQLIGETVTINNVDYDAVKTSNSTSNYGDDSHIQFSDSDISFMVYIDGDTELTENKTLITNNNQNYILQRKTNITPNLYKLDLKNKNVNKIGIQYK